MSYPFEPRRGRPRGPGMTDQIVVGPAPLEGAAVLPTQPMQVEPRGPAPQPVPATAASMPAGRTPAARPTAVAGPAVPGLSLAGARPRRYTVIAPSGDVVNTRFVGARGDVVHAAVIEARGDVTQVAGARTGPIPTSLGRSFGPDLRREEPVNGSAATGATGKLGGARFPFPDFVSFEAVEFEEKYVVFTPVPGLGDCWIESTWVLWSAEPITIIGSYRVIATLPNGRLVVEYSGWEGVGYRWMIEEWYACVDGSRTYLGTEEYWVLIGESFNREASFSPAVWEDRLTQARRGAAAVGTQYESATVLRWNPARMFR